MKQINRSSHSDKSRSAANKNSSSRAAAQLVEEEEMAQKKSISQLVEEEELQGKFTSQLMKEEEMMQGKFTSQLVEEDELQGKFTSQLVEEEELQGKFTSQLVEEEELAQGKMKTTQLQTKDSGTAQLEENAPATKNNTGMPDNLKSGIESLSGVDISDVRVHYNSDKPAQMNAHAFAQGTDIHVAPGQEKHLPHEAWHTVQQKQGRVQATTEVNGSPVNDNASLENEADVMGAKANSL